MKTLDRHLWPGAQGESERGSVLIPCLFFLALLSMLSLSVTEIGGVNNVVCSALKDNVRAQFAAQSGIEIAYSNLAADPSYRGEVCTPFANASRSIEISVTPLEDCTYDVLASAAAGRSERRVRSVAQAREQVSEYPLCVGDEMELKGKSSVLGDVYVGGVLRGMDSALIFGNVFMPHPREVSVNASGEAIAIDDVAVPTIHGTVYPEMPQVTFPMLVLDELRDRASATDQLFSGTLHFQDQDFTGVVFVEGSGSTAFFDNVTIHGILVCDHIAEVRVTGGFIKLHCDDAICPKVALLAPGTALWVDPNGLIDVYGLSLFEAADFQGSGTFTGPLIVREDLVALPKSYLYCQFPDFMNEILPGSLRWSEHSMVELSYEEL